MAKVIDFKLLEQIDKITLSEKNKEWRKAMKASGWRVSPDRERWTVKSWKETEGRTFRYAAPSF